MIARSLLLATSLLLLSGAGLLASAQGNGAFAVRAAAGQQGSRPVLELPELLGDPVLQNALESGLPLRFHLRVELWQKGLLDRLADAEELSLAVVQDPLDGLFRVETGRATRVFSTLFETQSAVRSILTPSLQARRPGRYYYLATLEVETLSLSDLDELRRWLRGEVQPAVEGRTSAGRAVERGLRRVVVRVLGLPTRRFETRSANFIVR